jgi:WD40 repeat protein
MRIRAILRPLCWLSFSSLTLLAGTGLVCAQSLSLGDKPGLDLDSASSMLSTEIVIEKLPRATSAPVVTALAGSRDGRYMAAAGDDHAIRIIDAATGKTIQTVLGHQDWIKSLLFVYHHSHSTAEATSGDVGQAIKLGNSAAAELDSSTQAVSSAEDSVIPDLYSAGHDGRVLRWRYKYPLEAEEIAIVPFAIRSISISAQQNLLAIGGFTDEVLIYDLKEGLYLHRLMCSMKDQRTVRFSPDGSRVLAGSNNGEIQVWDSRSGESIAVYREHQRRVHNAVFSADGTCVTSAGEDRRVIRYSLSDNRVLWSSEIALSKMMSLCLINDDMIAVAGADNKVRLVDAQSEAIVAELSGHTGTVAVITTCGPTLVTGSFDTTVRLWNLTGLEENRVQSGRPTSRTPITVDSKTQIR